MDRKALEVQLKKSGMASVILAGLMILPLGILIFLVKEEIEHLKYFVVVGVLPPIIISYKNISKQDKKIFEYLDFRRYIILAMIGISVVFIPYYAFKINFNRITGAIFIFGGGLVAITNLMEILKNKKNDDKEIDKLILNSKGLKIPEYKFIPWDEVRDVVEYKDGPNDVIGIIVDSVLEFKERRTVVDYILIGRERRLIQIKMGLIMSDKKNMDRTVSEYINYGIGK